MIHISSGVKYDKVERHAELDVVSAYHISVPDGWIHRERFLDLSELIYVTEGKLHLAINGKEVTLCAGDAYLIHRYATLTGKRASVGVCGFYTVDFSCTLEKYDRLYGKILQISSRSSYAETLFNNMRFSGSGEQGESYLPDASMVLLLDLLYTSGKREPERMQMQGILRYIDEQLSTPLTVDQISEHFHYSSDYLGKIFRGQFGVTLRQYIIEKKLSAAKRLLSTSDISVKLVGQAVGFPEPPLFEKFFRYHVNMTPKKYRELYH